MLAPPYTQKGFWECDDGTSKSGGAVFWDNFRVDGGATCTMCPSDSYGDGWNGDANRVA